MRSRLFLRPALAALSAVFITSVAQADSLPGWVRDALQTTPVVANAETSAIVLLDERVVRVDKRGRMESRTRQVVRVLTSEGSKSARREVLYDSRMSLGDVKAWHLRADQRVFEFDTRTIIERAVTPDLYSDIRARVISFDGLDVGSTVAFEWVTRETPLVNQDQHFFQAAVPVIRSRYELTLPRTWRVESKVFNHAAVDPVVEAGTYAWEVRDLAAMPQEPLMTDPHARLASLAVSYFPDAGRVRGASVSSWQAVAEWAQRVMIVESRKSPELRDRAMEMTASLRSPAEKIRAICDWAQRDVRYVSIQLGPVGGYRPAAPDVVLSRRYGDCKDKSNLVRAMLDRLGVTARVVLVHSGDPSRVKPDFPSPLQFNHAILALPAAEDLPATINHPTLGRLTFFDPSDRFTRLGELPFYLQGGHALIVDAENGDLVRLPEQSAEANLLKREIELRIDGDGAVSGEIAEIMTGQVAARARHSLATAGRERYGRMLGSRLAQELPGSAVTDVVVEAASDPRLPLKLTYRANSATVGSRSGRLHLIRPLLLSLRDEPILNAVDRTSPILLDIRSVSEEIETIRVPEGYRVDELPSGLNIETDFATFDLAFDVVGPSVVVHRKLVIRQRLIPAAQYADLKSFLERARSASSASMVFAVN